MREKRERSRKSKKKKRRVGERKRRRGKKRGGGGGGDKIKQERVHVGESEGKRWRKRQNTHRINKHRRK